MPTKVAPIVCGLCGDKPLVKWLNDDDQWIWVCVYCAAAKGNPTALMLKANQWINGLRESVISVEAVQ